MLFVVFSALGYFEAAVDLLQEHNAEQMMGESHGRNADAPVGDCLYAGVQTVRAADYEADFGCAA